MQGEKTVQQRVTYWLGVAIVGILVGVGGQFAQAWTNPPGGDVIPPNGNVAGPITTGILNQIKQGGLSVASLLVIGKATSASTVKEDLGTTLVTKDYADKLVVPESTIIHSYKVVSHSKINQLINKGIDETSSDQRQYWQGQCIGSDEPTATAKLYVNKGCLNLLCYALVGKLPRMSDINGNCPTGTVTNNCSKGRFEIHFSCLNSINDSDKRQDWPEIK